MTEQNQFLMMKLGLIASCALSITLLCVVASRSGPSFAVIDTDKVIHAVSKKLVRDQKNQPAEYAASIKEVKQKLKEFAKSRKVLVMAKGALYSDAPDITRDVALELNLSIDD
jgi:hypothetical protein